ncbi:MAG: hypothetical protein EHM48_00035 [Planctomycetaceae bacterium]|nr:MAG: hypothetical protein EHM48_00035 [Planctomycetaceae bacterium]
MSWANELREEIKLTSPLGSVFYALWRNDERTVEKKLGIFEIPKFKGSIIQDLDVKATSYPLTFYFDGPFHNRTAEEFFTAVTEERGQWEVIHPVKGPLILQLVSCKESLSPVDEGSYTRIETSWLVPANLTRVISLDELASSIFANAFNVISDALTMLAQLRADLYSAIQSAIATFNAIAGLVDSIVAEITATVALVQDAYQSARAALDNALSAFGVGNADPTPVGEAAAELITVAVDATDDFAERFTAYNSLVTDTLNLVPMTTTEEDFNTLVSMEFNITMALVAIAQSVATSTFNTRADVVSAMDNITTLFNDTMEALDAAQDAFSTLPINRQYYANSQQYSSLVYLFALAMQYLTIQFYNLRAEKRFTVTTPRSPLEITVTEYGSLGDRDANYDLFIRSNQLAGNEILLIQPGREVVIYVG